MSRVTLPERLFPLHHADDVDRFLQRWPVSIVFKAGTSDKTIDAWMVAQKSLEPRADVPVGFIRLPDDRPASERVSVLADIAHRSPQVVLFRHARALFHLDEFAILPDRLVPLLLEHLPVEVGSPARNGAVVTLEPYRLLLSQFLRGDLPEARFQWAYLDRLAKEAPWRDDETFALLNGLFENEQGRDVRPARIVAVEFQGQLAGRLNPLQPRAARLLEQLAGR